ERAGRDRQGAGGANVPRPQVFPVAQIRVPDRDRHVLFLSLPLLRLLPVAALAAATFQSTLRAAFSVSTVFAMFLGQRPFLSCVLVSLSSTTGSLVSRSLAAIHRFRDSSGTKKGARGRRKAIR